jgi:hypothetical protein
MKDEPLPILPRILYALAFLLFCLRFLWPGDSVYILDEAFMQLRIDEHLAAGTIPRSNSRGSSIPLPYGPGALWIYMLIRQLSWHPEVTVLVHLFLQAVGAYFFVKAFRRAFGEEAAAWCVALAASSPLLFFYARHPWDSSFFLPLGALLLWLLRRLEEGGTELPLHAGLGLVAGYAVNIHLMFGAVALALAFTLFLRDLGKYGSRSPKGWLLLLVFGLSALAILLPYLLEAARIASAEQPMDHARVLHRWGDGRNLWWLFLRTTLYSSLYGSRIHLNEVLPQFYAFSGSLPEFFFRRDLFGWFGKLAAWGSAFAVAFQLLRLRVEKNLLRLFAAAGFFFTLLVYQYLNIPTASHYFNPIWWFVFVGIALAIRGLRGWKKNAFLFTLAASLAVNSVYVVLALAFIHENKGARTMETSVVASEQLRNIRELCGWAHGRGKNVVRVNKEAAVLGEPAFDFLPAHMPECAGVRILHHPRGSATSAALVAEPGNYSQPGVHGM